MATKQNYKKPVKRQAKKPVRRQNQKQVKRRRTKRQVAKTSNQTNIKKRESEKIRKQNAKAKRQSIKEKRNKIKAQNRRRNRKRNLRIMRFILLITILILCIYSFFIFFRIKEIEINGNIPYNKITMSDSLSIKKEDSLIFFDKFKLAIEIIEGYPYIGEITIRREYPNKLVINATKTQGFASVVQDGVYYLIDIKGKILEILSPEEAEEYPRIFGYDLSIIDIGKSIKSDDIQKQQALIEIIDVFSREQKLEYVTEISLEKIYDIKVNAYGKYEIHLGNTEEIDYKMKFLDEVLSKLTPSDTGEIDLSTPAYARFRPKEILQTPY